MKPAVRTSRVRTDVPAVSIIREFNASPEHVWRAWTDPAHFAQWFGPQGYSGVVDHMDVRKGGTFRFGMKGPDGNVIWSRGSYHEVKPFERLVYHEHEDGSDPSGTQPTWHLVISLTFEAIPKGTRMTMEQLGWPNEEWRSMAEGIWSQAFAKLAASLTS